MKLNVSNFGPVNKAEINFKTLTIIIGKNNLGKSYITLLVHVLTSFLCGTGFQSANLRRLQYFVRLGSSRKIYFPNYGRIVGFNDKEIKEIRKSLKNKKISSMKIHQFFLDKIRKELSSRYRDQLVNKLQQIYGVRIGKLVHLNATQAILEFSYNEYFTLKIVITKTNRLNLEFTFDEEQKKKIDEKMLPIINQKRKESRITKRKIYEIYSTYFPNFSIRFDDSFYIPAGRAGLIESYNTVASALTNLASWAPLHGLTMPPIPGVASEFYNRLLSLKGRKGPYAPIAEELKSILGGTLHLRKVRGIPSTASRIYYSFKKGSKTRRMDIIHAASMIKELSPLYLIVKEALFPNSLLLVEEPESHLHPSAQCRLIEFFVRLIRKKSNIILTTHSDLIIRKIGNLVGSYKYDGNEKRTALNPSSVAIYFLKQTIDGDVSRELPIPEDGIFENIPEFDEVINELYEEQLILQQKEQMEIN